MNECRLITIDPVLPALALANHTRVGVRGWITDSFLCILYFTHRKMSIGVCYAVSFTLTLRSLDTDQCIATQVQNRHVEQTRGEICHSYVVVACIDTGITG
jgi:hypothetical protein